jgi:hypothetical protein
MPGFDGTGPRGSGPMTGRARGYCMLRTASGESNDMQGFAGAQGTPVGAEPAERERVAETMIRDGIRPAASRPVVGHSTAHFVPGYGTVTPMGRAPLFDMYGVMPYGYRQPWWPRVLLRPWFGRVLGCRRGRGRRRGWLGFPW